jgi:hypothetical protein
MGTSHRACGVRLEVCNPAVSIQVYSVVFGSVADRRQLLVDPVSAEAHVMNIRELDTFRAALLVILLAGVIIATWHVAWLHKHTGDRYEMQLTGGIDHPTAVVILDRQDRVIYASRGFLGDEPIVWHTSPLPE